MILALAGDGVVTARGTRWNLPAVANGWLPPRGLWALTARVGPVRAHLLTRGMTDRDAPEALRPGLADAPAEDGGALAAAQALADRLAAPPPAAVRSTERSSEPVAPADPAGQDVAADPRARIGPAPRPLPASAPGTAPERSLDRRGGLARSRAVVRGSGRRRRAGRHSGDGLPPDVASP